MGIYDREYYRREGPSLLARGQVCKWLIIINVICFILQMVLGSDNAEPVGLGFVGGTEPTASFTDWFLLDASAVVHGQVWRLVTYAFLHDPNSLWHILFNMLFLYWFGLEMENMYGSREFLLFYLAAAVFGGLCFVVAYYAGVPGRYCLGASGAVTAVLVLCAIHYPNRIILVWFLPVPIWLLILFQLGPDAYHLLQALRYHGEAGSTAVAAHLGGAAFAVLYYQQNWRLARRLPNWTAWRRQMTGPRLRVYREEAVPASAAAHAAETPAHDIDEHMEAKVDYVLEKVARSGQDSLTDSERQILLRASEVYKRRRT